MVSIPSHDYSCMLLSHNARREFEELTARSIKDEIMWSSYLILGSHLVYFICAAWVSEDISSVTRLECLLCCSVSSEINDAMKGNIGARLREKQVLLRAERIPMPAVRAKNAMKADSWGHSYLLTADSACY